MRTLLITGASGFIGSHLAEQALASGYDVWCMMRPSSSKRWLTDPRLHFCLTPPAPLPEGVNFDYVVHAAGATKCLRDEDFERANVEGTRRLVETLGAQGVKPRRFVFISSLTAGYDDTAYGRSKARAEEYLRTTGLPLVILRPTGVYGPRESDYRIMAQSIARHVDFAVGFEPQVITFVYVRDLCQAILNALSAEGAVGQTYDISDGDNHSSRDFSLLLQREMGVRHVLHITAPLWFLRAVCTVSGLMARLTGRPSTLNMDKYHIMARRDWRCDITPAREQLGYEPQWPLERGVRETVRSWNI